jgi:hypothetical protein
MWQIRTAQFLSSYILTLKIFVVFHRPARTVPQIRPKLPPSTPHPAHCSPALSCRQRSSVLVFCDVRPYSLVGHFWGIFCHLFQGILKMETASFSVTTRRHVPEGSNRNCHSWAWEPAHPPGLRCSVWHESNPGLPTRRMDLGAA